MAQGTLSAGGEKPGTVNVLPAVQTLLPDGEPMCPQYCACKE